MNLDSEYAAFCKGDYEISEKASQTFVPVGSLRAANAQERPETAMKALWRLNCISPSHRPE